MKKLASFYVPFLFMTVPVALLFRLGDLIGTSASPSLGGFGAWISALVIPFLALVAPLVLFWQAGALFFVGDRVASHASVQRAKQRTNRVRQGLSTGKQGSQDFIRGLRNEPAVSQTGQESGPSRAHSVGQRLNRVGAQLRSSGDDSSGPSSEKSAGYTSEYDRSNHEQLRDSDRRRTTDSTNEQPRYIQ
jgi:hypothetical protein